MSSSPRDTGRAMSQENVETVQRAVEAWNADDLDGFLAELDADVEWHPAIQPGLEGKATTYRGHDGARTIWRQDRGEAWERLTNRPQEFRDLPARTGDLLLVRREHLLRTTAACRIRTLGERCVARGCCPLLRL